MYCFLIPKGVKESKICLNTADFGRPRLPCLSVSPFGEPLTVKSKEILLKKKKYPQNLLSPFDTREKKRK